MGEPSELHLSSETGISSTTTINGTETVPEIPERVSEEAKDNSTAIVFSPIAAAFRTPTSSNNLGSEFDVSSISEAIQSENNTVNDSTQESRNEFILVNVSNEQRPRDNEEEMMRTTRVTWPHDTSCVFACFSCIVGMYNISRFSILVYLYKACFILEFFIISLLVGIPFLSLQMTLGQYVGSGFLEMWYISPAFKGIGFALLYVYIILGVYSAIPVSWLLIYFKDSFIANNQTYRWNTCLGNFSKYFCIESQNQSSTDYVGWSVSSYFHGIVLDRRSDSNDMDSFRFELVFNLAIVWLIIFLVLSRGNRFYGKLVYALTLVPVGLLFLVAVKVMEQWGSGIATLFDVPWKTTLADPTSWLLATREAFLTWMLYGTLCLNMCSHNKISSCVIRNLLMVVVGVTFILIFSSLVFASSMREITDKDLIFIPSSFEEPETVNFLLPLSKFDPSKINVTPLNFIIGECFFSFDSQTSSSGYQVIRYATEIFPAILALGGTTAVSWFWSVTFYLLMIMFGLAQQAAIWSVVIESLITLKPKILKSWQTFLTFICCDIGFLLGLPMTTNVGMFILFFFDACVGSLWCVGSVFLIMIIAILFIRGCSNKTNELVHFLSEQQKTCAFLLQIIILQWNVILPVAFMVLFIAFARSGNVDSPDNVSDIYWPLWEKNLGVFV
ncbi:sodium-dependent transporter bedraggled-like [Tachypleus tridentatus]|uniref:sodium-dependent transporter bedraggled-like n=1 Tax=Tachypleus tridentatus TaxID=6853 RepID=UPI003FD1B57D